jgi:hypothetical protein
MFLHTIRRLTPADLKISMRATRLLLPLSKGKRPLCVQCYSDPSLKSAKKDSHPSPSSLISRLEHCIFSLQRKSANHITQSFDLVKRPVAFKRPGRNPLERRKERSMNIYIGNLSFQTTEGALESLFAEFGEIKSVKVIKDRTTGTPRGFGFIEMPNNSEADQAIKALNGNRLDGNTIKVNPADSGTKRRKKRNFRQRWY